MAKRDGCDYLLPHLLFAIQEVPQESMGFSLFELVYGWHTQGLLDVVRDVGTRYYAQWEHSRTHCSNAGRNGKGHAHSHWTFAACTRGSKPIVQLVHQSERVLTWWLGSCVANCGQQIPSKMAGSLLDIYKVYQPTKRKPYKIYHVNQTREEKRGFVSGPENSGRSQHPG